MLLEVEDLSIRFGGVKALQEVSLDVPAGSVTALIGPNGAGKTTLFNCVTGVYEPDAGRVGFDRRELRGPPHRRAREGLGRTYQQPQVFGSLSVRENLEIGLRAQARTGCPYIFDRSLAKVSPDERAETIARMCGYERPLDVLAGSLSFGDVRIVEVARALCAAPRLLMLDEPAAGLDADRVVAISELLLDLRDAGVGVLLVEHDVEMVMGIADAVVVLDFGVVIAQGAPDDVQNDDRVIEAYLGEQHA